MTDGRDALEGPAMRSSGAATGTRRAMPACSISTTTGPTTATTTSASADPRTQHPGAGMPDEGTLLGRASRGTAARPESMALAPPGTAAGPTGAAVGRGSPGKQAFVAAQWRQVKGAWPMVTCECDLTLPLRFAYRCLYCGQFYCQVCAEIHFGKTRDEFNRERIAA